jgi:hypothetical protein
MRTETLPLKGTEDLQPSEGVSKTERERETSKLVPGIAKPAGQVGETKGTPWPERPRLASAAPNP